MTIPEWDGVDIEVRAVSAATRAQIYETSLNETGEVDDTKVTLNLVIATVMDPETKAPLFTVADRDSLAAKSSVVIDRISAVALRLCGMGAAATKAIEGN